MYISRRLIAAAVLVTLSASVSIGCTSMHTVRPVTDASAAPFGPVKAGDKVAVELRDGRTEAFVVQRVDQDTLVSTANHVYSRGEIVELKRRSISGSRTTLLVAGISVGAFLALVAAALASGGVMVY